MIPADSVSEILKQIISRAEVAALAVRSQA